MSEILTTDKSKQLGHSDHKQATQKSREFKRKVLSMSVDELKAELLALHRALCSARLQLSMGKMKDVSQFSKLRKDIARINLFLASKKKMGMTNG